MTNDSNAIQTSAKKNVIIISGLAGSGKTIAIHALEDLGYYCIDNLPAVLLQSFADSIAGNTLKASHIALALDSRDTDNPITFEKIYPLLLNSCNLTVLFFKATSDVVMRRFRETRRQHPLSKANPLLNLHDIIALDEKTLEPIFHLANRTIDSTHLSSQNLKKFIYNQFSITGKQGHLLLNIVSFGFKHGTPSDLDTYFDVRCFKNPHYEPEIKHLTGLTKEIKDYVFSDPNVDLFINKVTNLINFFYPLYLDEGKHYFSLGIGCTGGKHRSVAIAEELASIFRKQIPLVTIEHRNIDKD